MTEQIAEIGDVELCFETFGDSADPAMLLIMGLGTQMIAWHEEFCRGLTREGFHVIRFDNRDIGRSTRFDSVPPPRPAELLRRRYRRLAYTLADMADDAAGLLDHLGIGAAHVVGASMGGMIAQLLAANHPDRVLSLTSIMSSTGHRWSGQPALRVYPYFLRRPEDGREAYVERIVKLFKVVGSPGFETDENALREMAERSFERGASAAGTARQMAAIGDSGDRTPLLRQIKAPTLVIHGSADRLVATSGGRATARAVPDAELMIVDGMGHDLPRGAWPQIIDGIVRTATRADSEAATPAA